MATTEEADAYNRRDLRQALLDLRNVIVMLIEHRDADQIKWSTVASLSQAAYEICEQINPEIVED